MPYKVSFGFGQQTARDGGWTENFWINQASAALAMERAKSLLQQLIPIHGQSTILKKIRVSNATNSRDVLLYKIPNPTGAGTGPQTISDYPTSALFFKMTGDGNYSTGQWFKGIWDSVVADGGYYVPSSTYINSMNALIAALVSGGGGWVLRVLDRAQEKKLIRDISNAGNVFCKGHGFPDKSRVRISKVKTPLQANGLWRINLVDADNFLLNGWTPLPVAIPYTKDGTARLQLPIYPAIVSAEVVFATSHKVGRPLDQLSGRRGKRRT